MPGTSCVAALAARVRHRVDGAGHAARRRGGAVEWRHRVGVAVRASRGGSRGRLACIDCAGRGHTMAGELDEAETLLARMIRRMTPACPWPSALRGISICRVGPAMPMRSWSRLRRTTRVATATRAFLDACGGDVAAAATAADAALRCTGIDDLSAMLAATAKMIAAGEVGRVDDLASTAEFARTLGVTSPSTGLLRFAFAEAHCSALQLLGLTDAADPVGGVHERRPTARCLSVGRDDGRFGQPESRARRPRRQAAARRVVGAPLCVLGGWLCRYYVDLAIALAVRGEADAAMKCLTRLASARRPEMGWLEPMEMLATAWVSAAVGAVTRAIGEARSAAVTAAARGQPAREVLCLQTATRFGDTTTVTRLGELVSGGRRRGARRSPPSTRQRWRRAMVTG